MGSVCVGTFILGAAGVLNGSTCTTHWVALEQFRHLDQACAITVPTRYPRQLVDTAHKRFTGGGVSSSIDLALTLLRDLGSISQANHSALMNQYAPILPTGVLPGQPNEADPATVASIENDPQIHKNFLAPIIAGVDQILAKATK
ncbi:MAG: hypothetical protein ACSHXB_05415 [Sulfitobacter sp.]